MTTLTEKITVDVGNGIGGLTLFFIDSSTSPTVKDSFGNTLDKNKGSTNTNFPGSLVYASANTGSPLLVHNYHII